MDKVNGHSLSLKDFFLALKYWFSISRRILDLENK